MEKFDVRFYADSGENGHWNGMVIEDGYSYKDLLNDVKQTLHEMGGGEAEVINEDGDVYVVYSW